MFVEILLQHDVHFRFLPEHAPQQEADGGQADREHLPPGPLVLAAHGALHPPGAVAARAGGELDGFILHLVSRLRGRGRLLRAQGGGPGGGQPAWRQAGSEAVE